MYDRTGLGSVLLGKSSLG